MNELKMMCYPKSETLKVKQNTSTFKAINIKNRGYKRGHCPSQTSYPFAEAFSVVIIIASTHPLALGNPVISSFRCVARSHSIAPLSRRSAKLIKRFWYKMLKEQQNKNIKRKERKKEEEEKKNQELAQYFPKPSNSHSPRRCSDTCIGARFVCAYHSLEHSDSLTISSLSIMERPVEALICDNEVSG